MTDFASVNWSNPSCPVSKYFLVREVLWLPSDDRMATPNDWAPGMWDEVVRNAHQFANEKMDAVREWRKTPIGVHEWCRPPAYNTKIGGARNSAHIEGIACDFDFGKQNCAFDIQAIRDACILASMGLRMENNSVKCNGAPAWIHLDSREPGPAGRYFLP